MMQEIAAYAAVAVAAGWLGWRWLPRRWRLRLARRGTCSGGCGCGTD